MPNDNPNTQGLAPFQKGESGNPLGRPLGIKNRSTIAREILKMAAQYPDDIFEKLQQRFPSLEKQMTIEEMMTVIQVHKAIANADTYGIQRTYGQQLRKGHSGSRCYHKRQGSFVK